jgi:vanillate O-demethylase monooxygenase subunit
MERQNGYPTEFPHNQWYVAARSAEVGEELFPRWLLGEPVVLYRTKNGSPVALADRCPHRQYPLSKGQRIGDAIQCGYHGLEFASDGRCIRVPQQDHIPQALRADAYPLSERWGFIWIWMGDAARADQALIPDHSFMAREGWVTVSGTLHLRARAQLMNENLLDLSHLTYLHPTSLGTAKVAEVPAETEWDQRSVRVRRLMQGIESPGFFVRAMGLSGLIDRTQLAEFFAPGLHITHVSAKPAGDSGDSGLCQHKVVHGITPETWTSTHYFWAMARDYHIHDAEITRYAQEAQASVFAQDVDACEAIERVLTAYEPDGVPQFNIKVDAGPLQARRIVERMAAEERARHRTPQPCSSR